MRKFILLMSIILIAGCDNDTEVAPNVCGWTGSIDDIPWVAALKASIANCTCEPAIIKGTYQNQTVIFIALTNTATCDYIWTPTLYDCEGNEIRTFTTSAIDQQELYEMVTRDTIVYKCKN